MTSLYLTCHTVYISILTVEKVPLMKIIIKNKSELPIYEQIKEQIKAQILEGKVSEDEQLP